ncbi:MAG: ATP-binding protein [Bacteroidales bacterium]|nr:ATP-binding protein [Bacteroidales bacterium]
MIKSKHHIIAIASGKGGTGKTFVATNLFHALKETGENVMLIDCDAEAPNALAFFDSRQADCIEVTQQVPVIDSAKCTFCGKCHEYCAYNAIFILPSLEIIKVIEDLCHACGACLVACKYDAITQKSVTLGQVSLNSINENVNLIEARTKIGVMTPVLVIKAAIRQIDHRNNIVILDSPPGTSCPFIHTVAAADYVVLVTEPTPFGLSDLKRSVETLKQMNKPFGVIVNRAGIGNNEVYDYLESEGIELLLEIPFDKEIARICSNGGMVVNHNPALKHQLLKLEQKITDKHGIGHHQR